MTKKYELIKNETFEHEGQVLYRIRALRDIITPVIYVEAGTYGGFVAHEGNLSQDGDCWVQENAKVFGNAAVNGDALITNNAQVYGAASIEGTAQIRDTAKVYDNASVCDNVRIRSASEVFGFAVVQGKARISQGSRISESASVRDSQIVGAVIKGAAIIRGNCDILGATILGTVSLSSRAVIRRYGGHEPVLASNNDWMVFDNVGSENGVLTVYRGTDNALFCTRGCFTGTTDDFLQAVQEEHGTNHIAQEYGLMIQAATLRLNRRTKKEA